MSSDELKRVASALGVPDMMEHVLQRIGELNEPVTRIRALHGEIDSLTNQRDEFEKMMGVARQVYIAALEDPNV